MFSKIAAAVADKVQPRTPAHLKAELVHQYAELRRPHEGGVSFLEYFRRPGRTDWEIATDIRDHLREILIERLKAKRAEVIVSVHYYNPPIPMLSICLVLTENDYTHPPVYERFSIDLAPPEAVELVPDGNGIPVKPSPNPIQSSKAPAATGGKPVTVRKT